MAATSQSAGLVFADKDQLKLELNLADPQSIQAEASADPELDKQASDIAGLETRNIGAAMAGIAMRSIRARTSARAMVKRLRWWARSRSRLRP